MIRRSGGYTWSTTFSADAVAGFTNHAGSYFTDVDRPAWQAGGAACYGLRRGIRHRFFSLIALIYGKTPTVYDPAIAQDVRRYGGYRLVIDLPYHTASERGAFLVSRGLAVTGTATIPGDGIGIPGSSRPSRLTTSRRLPTPGARCHSSLPRSASAQRASSRPRHGWKLAYRLMLPFAGYTLLYLAYQALSLPMNFTGRQLRPRRPQSSRCIAWQPEGYPEHGHLPAHLRRALRSASQHVGRRV